MMTTSSTNDFKAYSVLFAALAVAAGVLMMVWVAEPARAAFPGTSGKIAFVSDRNDPNAGTQNSRACEIFVMDPNGSNQTNLTNDTAKCDESPTFSPNGSRIAFNSYDGNDAEIYVMGADGSNRTRLTDDRVDDNPPAFARDGTKITFGSTLDGGADPEIYVMDASDTDGDGVGDHLTQLTDNSARDVYPVFSPRENKIAFSSNRDGNWDLYLMDVSRGGNPPIKLTDDALTEGVPNFSPDGREIAYDSSDDFAEPGTNDSDVYVVSAFGTGTPTNLTNTPTTWEDSPAFSPDGKKIVFRSFVSQWVNSDIYVMNSNGSGTPTNLTNNAAHDYMPDWGIDTSSSVIGTNPANTATRVERNTNVAATFSEEMDSTSIDTSTFKLYRWNKKRREWVPVNSTTYPNTVSYDPSSKTAMLDPYGDTTALLEANRKYKAVVSTGAKDANGVALSDNLAWTFTTGGS
jgi:Tol biopolymer transport system component